MTADFKNDIKKASQLLKSGNLNKYQEIELDRIELDPNQPRKEFDSESLKQLADSIDAVGVLQPITVRPIENEKFILCFGERRFRASQYIKKETIPALIINTDENMLEKQLVENIQRSDLNHEEIASSIKHLIEIKKMKKKDIAVLIGKSAPYVGNYHQFSKMDYVLRNMLQERTTDMTLIIEIKKIIEDIKEEDKKQRILAYIEEQTSINRNTPKEIKDMFLEKTIETIDILENEKDVTGNQEVTVNNSSNNEFAMDSSKEEESRKDNQELKDEFDDEEYCDDYNDDSDKHNINETPKEKTDVYNSEHCELEELEESNTRKQEVNENKELLSYVVEEEMSIFSIDTETFILSFSDEFFNKLKANNRLSSFNKLVSEFLK